MATAITADLNPYFTGVNGVLATDLMYGDSVVVTGGSIFGVLSANVTAGGLLAGELRSRQLDVWGEADQHLTLTTGWAWDDLWAAALHGSAGGDFKAAALHGSAGGDFKAGSDGARLWAKLDVGGEVTAMTNADVYAYRSDTADGWAIVDVTQPERRA